ncbi:hypothetical protein WAI453_004915 [Rhynchosporium graminicola]
MARARVNAECGMRNAECGMRPSCLGGSIVVINLPHFMRALDLFATHMFLLDAVLEIMQLPSLYVLMPRSLVLGRGVKFEGREG